MNQYIEAAKIGLAILTFIVDVIREHKASEQAGEAGDVSGQVDKSVSLLQSIGKIAKVKELQALDITELKPAIGDFIGKIRELKKLNKD